MDAALLSRPVLHFALCTAFNPLFWNIVARNEHRHRTITKLVGSPLRGCYLLAATIFTLGLYRDYVFMRMMDKVPPVATPLDWMLEHDATQMAAYALMVAGNILVLTSMYRLGVTGTYLGDYFGILMKERVTGFPFNSMNNPMYNGSTMIFLSSALFVGLVMAIYVYVVYRLALMFEEYVLKNIIELRRPFTNMIYANASGQNTTATAKNSPRRVTRSSKKQI